MTAACKRYTIACAVLLGLLPYPASSDTIEDASQTERSFAADVEFLQTHVETVVLSDGIEGARVAVTPAYQGRVMTSSAGGDHGDSYGWINYALIASGEHALHINFYGGEERFWLGPEGGQLSVFFPPGADFQLQHWQTPPLIDNEPFPVTEKSEHAVAFRKDAVLMNRAGFQFQFTIDRRVELLSSRQASPRLGVDLSGLNLVGYRTTNRITNTGETAWTQQSGLLSVWLLGMYKPSQQTTVVIPFRTGDAKELGPVINDA